MMTRILAKDHEPTPELNEYLREASKRLPRYFHEVMSVEWDLSLDGSACVVAFRVHSKSGYYRARGTSVSFQKSAGEALDKVIRQRRRRKVMRQTSRRLEKPPVGDAAAWAGSS